jgi:hypothetical protein
VDLSHFVPVEDPKFLFSMPNFLRKFIQNSLHITDYNYIICSYKNLENCRKTILY